MAVGDVIRTLRESRGWTRGELSHRSLLSETTLRRLETGDLDDISRGTWRLLALALAVPEEDLAGERLSVTSLTELVAAYTAAAGQQGGAAQGASGALRLAAVPPERDESKPGQWGQPTPVKGAGKRKKMTKHADQPAVPAKKRGGSGGPKPGGPRKAG